MFPNVGGSLYRNGLRLGLYRSLFCLKTVKIIQAKGSAANSAKKVAVTYSNPRVATRFTRACRRSRSFAASSQTGAVGTATAGDALAGVAPTGRLAVSLTPFPPAWRFSASAPPPRQARGKGTLQLPHPGPGSPLRSP